MSDKYCPSEHQKFAALHDDLWPEETHFPSVLTRPLHRNYWFVEEALGYLCLRSSTQRMAMLTNENHPLAINIMALSNATDSDVAEMRVFWNDTNHKVKPRNSDLKAIDDKAEYSVSYFVEWALCKGFEIHWLDWAIKEGLYSSQKEPSLPKELPFSVDWLKWGKIRRIEVGLACGLMVGVDLLAYKYMQDFYLDKITNEPDEESREDWRLKKRECVHSVEERLLSRLKIISVVNNHIESKSFIDIEASEISYEEMNRRNPLINQPLRTDGRYAELYVGLPEFGAWALSIGYSLPPEFPTVKHDKITIDAVIAGAAIGEAVQKPGRGTSFPAQLEQHYLRANPNGGDYRAMKVFAWAVQQVISGTDTPFYTQRADRLTRWSDKKGTSTSTFNRYLARQRSLSARQ